MPDKPRNRVYIGNIVFDLSDLTLRSEGQRIQLGDQPARIFRFLIEHQDRVVTRGELYELFWPGVADGAEHNLNAAIRQIRRAIGDDGVNARYIQTIPKRGYQAINLAKENPLHTISFFKTAFRQLTLQKAAVATLCVATFFAIIPVIVDGRSDAKFEISEVDSNCSDTTTKRFETIVRNEVAVAVSETHPEQEVVVKGEPNHLIRGTHFSLKLLANYGRTNGIIYVQIIDNRRGSILWTRKYAVDLSETGKVATSIGADVKTVVKTL